MRVQFASAGIALGDPSNAVGSCDLPVGINMESVALSNLIDNNYISESNSLHCDNTRYDKQKPQ